MIITIYFICLFYILILSIIDIASGIDKTTNHLELFYMYDLSEEFWWRWPIQGTESTCKEQGYLGHEHAINSGIGPLVHNDSGLFLTWHFSLFNSLYNRLKRSSQRTMNPDEASIFIIPYDLGLDGYMDKQTCRNRRSCTHGLVGKLTNILKDSVYFNRHEGLDHVVLWSLGQYHPWPHNGCDVFMKNTCHKCTFTCYWMDATRPESRFVSIPFPSGYHWWDKIKDIPWELPSKYDQIQKPHRNLTAVYLGSIQTLNPAHTKIRRAMTSQCNMSIECHWMQIGHSSIDNNIADFLSVYRKAIFCLIPPGDDPARKALFDAILSGCIPVIFEVATIYNQYPWHIGEQNALDISVNIPGGQVRAGKLNFMKVLLDIKPEVIRRKQEAIARVAPRIQYAIPPIEYLQNISDTTRWDPPFPDGVDALLQGLFHRVRRLVANESSGLPLRLMTGREWATEYDIIKIQVPNITHDIMNVSNIVKDFKQPVIIDKSSANSNSILVPDMRVAGLRHRNHSFHHGFHKKKSHAIGQVSSIDPYSHEDDTIIATESTTPIHSGTKKKIDKGPVGHSLDPYLHEDDNVASSIVAKKHHRNHKLRRIDNHNTK